MITDRQARKLWKPLSGGGMCGWGESCAWGETLTHTWQLFHSYLAAGQPARHSRGEPG